MKVKLKTALSDVYRLLLRGGLNFIHSTDNHDHKGEGLCMSSVDTIQRQILTKLKGKLKMALFDLYTLLWEGTIDIWYSFNCPEHQGEADKTGMLKSELIDSLLACETLTNLSFYKEFGATFI